MVIFLPSLDNKVIGEFGQVTSDPSAIYKGDLSLRDYLYTSGLEGKQFHPVKTTPKAKLTDFLNSPLTSVPSQLIVTSKLLSIFKKYEGQKFEVGNINIRHASRHLPHHVVIRTERMGNDIIDFEKSEVAHLNWRKQRYEPLDCSSLAKFEELKIAQIVTLFFHKEHIAGLHHFVCPFLNILFISDEMAESMIEAKVSGVELYKYEESSLFTQNELRNSERIW